MSKPTPAQAFDRIAELEYRKRWLTTGECIVLREEWFEGGQFVRAVEHNYLEDTKPAPEPKPDLQTISAADVASVEAVLGGAAAKGQAGKLG